MFSLSSAYFLFMDIHNKCLLLVRMFRLGHLISGPTCRHMFAVSEYASMGGLLLLRSQVGDISLEGRPEED